MMQMEKTSRRGGLGAQAAPEHEVAKVSLPWVVSSAVFPALSKIAIFMIFRF